MNISLCKEAGLHEPGLCKLYPDGVSPVTSDGRKGYCRCRIGMGGIAALSAAFLIKMALTRLKQYRSQTPRALLFPNGYRLMRTCGL